MRGEEQVAHGDDAEQAFVLVDHEPVRHERGLDQLAHLLDGLGDGLLRPEHRRRRLHQATDRFLLVLLVFEPLRPLSRTGRGQDPAAGVFGHVLEDVLGDGGIDGLQRLHCFLR
jgi:hypothetical protein